MDLLIVHAQQCGHRSGKVYHLRSSQTRACNSEARRDCRAMDLLVVYAQQSCYSDGEVSNMRSPKTCAIDKQTLLSIRTDTGTVPNDDFRWSSQGSWRMVMRRMWIEEPCNCHRTV